MKKLKTNRGITLIALVVTIIVLLILAAVSIATLTGENGILSQATKAGDRTTEETEKEEIKLSFNAAKSKKYEEGDYTGKVTASEFDTELKKQDKDTEVTPDSDPIEVKFKNTGNIYKVTQDGTVNIEKQNGSSTDEGETGKTVEDLKIGDTVRLPFENGYFECTVLYDKEYNTNPENNASNYGIQIMLDDDNQNIKKVTLGDDTDFEKAVESFNNAIKILNDEAQKYVDDTNRKFIETYLEGNHRGEYKVRCIGSVPDDPYSEEQDKYYINTDLEWFNTKYSNTFKDSDIRALNDYGEPRERGRNMIDVDDFLACRCINDYSQEVSFSMYKRVFAGHAVLTSVLDYSTICTVDEEGEETPYTAER